jgi:hypothetical protein
LLPILAGWHLHGCAPLNLLRRPRRRRWQRIGNILSSASDFPRAAVNGQSNYEREFARHGEVEAGTAEALRGRGLDLCELLEKQEGMRVRICSTSPGRRSGIKSLTPDMRNVGTHWKERIGKAEIDPSFEVHNALPILRIIPYFSKQIP